MQNAFTPTHPDREILSTRVYPYARAFVFRAWTEPEHLARWWGPKDFTNTFHEFDLRPGGDWKFTMHGPNGGNYENYSVFQEIVPSERIVFRHVSPPHFLASIQFIEEPGGTRVLWSMLFDNAKTYDAVKGIALEGNQQNLDRLGAELARMA